MKDTQSEDFQIRRMVGADAVAVVELATELGYPSEAETIRARIEKIGDSDLLLVAVTAEDKPIAFVQAHRVCIIEAGFRVEILGLVVSAKTRRSGIGKSLIAEVERWAASIDAQAVVVRSNTQRTESHIFYPALGYEQIKTQAVYEKRLQR